MFMVSKFSAFGFIPISACRKIVYINLNKVFKTLVIVLASLHERFMGTGCVI